MNTIKILIKIIFSCSVISCSSQSSPTNTNQQPVADTAIMEVATPPPVEADSTENEETVLEKESYICQAILDFPVIKDSASFINELVENCNVSNGSTMMKIKEYRKVSIYGSYKKYIIVETDCEWSNHLFDLAIFEENGRHVGTIYGYKYGFVSVFPNEPDVLYSLDVTSQGNGGHEFFKIDNDTLKSMNTLYDDFPNTVCKGYYHWTYKPAVLNMTVSDDNKDGFNDLVFEGMVLLIDEETIDYDTDTYEVRKSVPVKFVLLYDKETKRFKSKTDYHKKYAVIFDLK